jgi:hypothetical protein
MITFRSLYAINRTWREAVVAAVAGRTGAFAIELVALGILATGEGEEAVEAILGQLAAM